MPSLPHITYAFLPLSLTHAYVSQAGVLLLLSGIAQLIMGTVVIVHMIMVLNEVHRGYVTCACACTCTCACDMCMHM